MRDDTAIISKMSEFQNSCRQLLIDLADLDAPADLLQVVVLTMSEVQRGVNYLSQPLDSPLGRPMAFPVPQDPIRDIQVTLNNLTAVVSKLEQSALKTPSVETSGQEHSVETSSVEAPPSE